MCVHRQSTHAIFGGDKRRTGSATHLKLAWVQAACSSTATLHGQAIQLPVCESLQPATWAGLLAQSCTEPTEADARCTPSSTAATSDKTRSQHQSLRNHLVESAPLPEEAFLLHYQLLPAAGLTPIVRLPSQMWHAAGRVIPRRAVTAVIEVCMQHLAAACADADVSGVLRWR
jgi:hypothetical protein